MDTSVLSIVIHTLPTVFALLAVIVAVRAARRTPAAMHQRIEQVELELSELMDRHESLHQSLKRLRSKVGMRELRARKQGEGDLPDISDPRWWQQRPEESVQEWKQRCRIAINTRGGRPG